MQRAYESDSLRDGDKRLTGGLIVQGKEISDGHPTTRHVNRATLRERDLRALKRIMLLSSEQQAIYKAALYRIDGLTLSERIRLGQIAYEMALAQNERNRARCGAPPPPPDYDPMSEPEMVVETEESGPGRGHRKTTIDEVNEMRYLHTVEGWSAARIWRDFPHLKETTVRDILKNKTWYDPNYTPPRARTSRCVGETVQQRTKRRYPES